jgi:glycine cleavage system regulatory protein
MFWSYGAPEKLPPMRLKKYSVEAVEKIDEDIHLEEKETELEIILKEVDKTEEQACEANKATIVFPVQSEDENSDCIIS